MRRHSRWPPGVAPPKAGRLLAGRYALRRCLGQGGYSEVWEAKDRLGGGRVAVKLLYEHAGSARPHLRTEIAILRLHQLPGVVRLLDEGVGEDLPFIVMELIDGAPFPGDHRGPCAWPTLARTAVALVESLARLHVEGVIHQDLTPANVLVDANGRPTVLDFGIASDSRLEEIVDENYLIGTVPYMAPELLRREALTPRADLYSLGVLLFEALTGMRPHYASHTRELILACAHATAPSLRRVAPNVPPEIAGLVDLLLSKRPEDRPRSALDVLGVLRGHPAPRPAAEPIINLGGDLETAEIVRLVRQQRSVDLVGPRRTGRSRCLEGVKRALELEGRRVASLRPAQRPFASLLPVVGALDQQSSPLVVVAAVVDAHLRAALVDGLVVLADDVERLDVHSAAALDRCGDAGAIVRVIEPATAPREGDASQVIRLTPLNEAALATHFAGPERLFHLRSSAARVLHARTGGLQAHVVEELREWLRAGIVASDGTELVVNRDLLDRLEARAPAPRLDTAFRDPDATSLRVDELIAWLSLAWPDGTPAILAACMNQAVWEIEAQLDDSVHSGAARRLRDGAVEPLVPASDDHLWSGERRRLGHLAIARAMPAGAPRRFLHLAMGLVADPTAAEVTALAEEAIVHARSLAVEGDLKRAIATLEEALLRVRRGSSTPEESMSHVEEQLLATLLDIALADGTALVVGEVHYELGRARARTEVVARLDQLAEAALAFAAGGERALHTLDALAPFADLELERRRQGLRALAARRCSTEIEDATLDDIARWAHRTADPVTRARFALWQGFWHYRRGRFLEAVRWHHEAGETDPSRLGRISARIAGASALMETFDRDKATRWASGALLEAQRCNSPFIEGRAEWILRALTYRSGLADAPDLELVAAAERLGVRDLEAAVCFTEATFAYRAGARDRVRELAQRAVHLWQFVRDPWPTLLGRCLALAAGEPPASSREITALGRRAQTCPMPGIGIQALGLLARARGSVQPAWRLAAPALADTTPRAFWTQRLDVLSIEESLEALGLPLVRGEEPAPDTLQ